MATTYILTTNGVDHSVTYTSKAKAVETAQAYVWAAQESKEGEHHISVRTEKTGKVVFEETVTHAPTVEIQGEYTEPETMTDIDGTEIPYDAFGSMAIQEARARIANGGCVGLCAIGTGCGHCDEQYGEIEPQTDVQSVPAVMADWERELIDNAGSLPVEPSPVLCQDCLTNEATIFDMDAPSCEECEAKISAMNEPAIETVCVVQNWAGTVGVNHYHAPECRDIQREMKRWNASEGMGMYSNSFSSVAEIISHEYSDICEDNAEMLSEANSDYAGIKVMPCLSIPFGELDSRPLLFVNGAWTLGEIVEDDETSYDVPSHTRYPHGRKGPEDTTAETEVFEPGTRVISKVTGERGTVVQPYITAVLEWAGVRMSAATVEMDNGGMHSFLIGDLMLKFECTDENGHIAPCAEATGEGGACCDIEDAGFEETMTTREYHLKVEVESGVWIDLGWHTFTVNASQAHNDELIASLYGERNGSGHPKGGWSAIITVIESDTL